MKTRRSKKLKPRESTAAVGQLFFGLLGTVQVAHAAGLGLAELTRMLREMWRSEAKRRRQK